MDANIAVRNLSKFYQVHQKEPGFAGSLRSFFYRRYETVRAVDEISFEIQSGEIVGFLGPNGAGKTTTLKVLSGLLYPTAGEVSVCGFRSYERNDEFLRQITLVMGQKNQLIWDLPAIDTFEVNRAIYDIPRSEYRAVLKELTDLLDLEPILRKQVRKLSLGERMKCELAAALLHRPRVLFLDEPTIGLDVTMQSRMREFLSEYNRRHGATILLTSHYMADVTALCKRILIIDRGHLVYDGELDALVEKVAPYKHIRIVTRRPILPGELDRFGVIRSMDTMEATLIVARERTSAVAAQLFEELPIADVTIEDPEVEEIINRIFTGEDSDMRLLRKLIAEYRAAWLLAIEYRLAVFIWMISMVLPLVMLAGWLAIAEGGSVGRFSRVDFIEYYVAAIVVRNLTGVWIIWDLDSHIRYGEFSFRLLKPLNPIVHYVAQSLSAKPLRLAIVLPLVLAVIYFVPGAHFASTPLMLFLCFLAVVGTWSMLFFIQYTNGLLSFWITQAIGINDMWFGVFSLFSGYLIPLDLFPTTLRNALYALPFRYMMSFPVEILTDQLSLSDILRGLALQWLWVGVFYLMYRIVWAYGLKKYSAVGA